MKMRFFLIVALIFTSFTAGAHRAKPAVKITHKAVINHFIKVTHKPTTKAIIKMAAKPVAKPVVKILSKPLVKPVVKLVSKPIVKPIVKVTPVTITKPSTKDIVKFDFKDEIKELSKSHDETGHVFLQIGKKDDADEKHYNHHDNDHGGNVNSVPVPAAVWLFGSALLGLVGVKRKSA